VLAETFALAASESQRLVDDLLADSGSRRFRVHLAGPDDAASLLSLQVAADVFLGAFGNTPELLRAEYAPLLPAMTHVVVLDAATRTAVGSLILQAAPAEELKTVVDAARPPWSMPVDRTLGALGLERGDRTGADLLLLAVRPGYRRLGLAQLLMYGGWMASLQRGIHSWTAILDDSLLYGMNLMTDRALRPIDGAVSAPYLGSPASTPVSVRMNPHEDVDLLRRVHAIGRGVSGDADFTAALESGRRALTEYSERGVTGGLSACAWPPRPAAPSATRSSVPSPCARPASP
jgi:GNAT superfamily N-acetyltransferase